MYLVERRDYTTSGQYLYTAWFLCLQFNIFCEPILLRMEKAFSLPYLQRETTKITPKSKQPAEIIPNLLPEMAAPVDLEVGRKEL